jgi:hypothetical protein
MHTFLTQDVSLDLEVELILNVLSAVLAPRSGSQPALKLSLIALPQGVVVRHHFLPPLFRPMS